MDGTNCDNLPSESSHINLSPTPESKSLVNMELTISQRKLRLRGFSPARTAHQLHMISDSAVLVVYWYLSALVVHTLRVWILRIVLQFLAAE